MEVLLALLLVAAVAYIVTVPLRSPARDDGPDSNEEAIRDDLEARKQAKYREIRDTELDHAQGKIDDADFERQDAELRAEAVAILKQIDEAEADAGRRQAELKKDAEAPDAPEPGPRSGGDPLD